jgi:hypothetical protein
VIPGQNGTTDRLERAVGCQRNRLLDGALACTGQERRHLWRDDFTKGIYSVRRANENIEIPNDEVIVECDQVDSLKLEVTNTAGELERELASILPLAVVGELVNRVQDQAKKVVHQIATLELLKVRW